MRADADRKRTVRYSALAKSFLGEWKMIRMMIVVATGLIVVALLIKWVLLQLGYPGQRFPELENALFHTASVAYPYAVWIVWGAVVVIQLWLVLRQWMRRDERCIEDDAYYIGAKLSGILMAVLYVLMSIWISLLKMLQCLLEVMPQVLLILYGILIAPKQGEIISFIADMFCDDKIQTRMLFCLIGNMALYLLCGWAFGILPWQW